MWIESSSARAAFRDDAAAIPAMTLRGGAAVDGYDAPPAHDSEADEPTDSYLEAYAYWGLAHLDAASWRHYLPGLIDYALRHLGEPSSMVTDGLLGSLLPPDREPPRLGSLSGEQEAVVMAVLDLAICPASLPWARVAPPCMDTVSRLDRR